MIKSEIGDIKYKLLFPMKGNDRMKLQRKLVNLIQFADKLELELQPGIYVNGVLVDNTPVFEVESGLIKYNPIYWLYWLQTAFKRIENNKELKELNDKFGVLQFTN